VVGNNDINQERIVGGPSEIFSGADRERVNQAIREAESATSAEILPVVACSSGRYDRPEDIVGVWFAALAMIIVWLVFPLPEIEAGNWDAPAPVWQLVALLAGALVGFVAGAFVGGRVDWLRRLFTPRAQMREEVYGRAREVFFDKRVHHTGGGSGVLLYVSLFEHMATVIADQSILDKLGQEQINEICREFTQRLNAGTPIDALCDTAVLLGRRLAVLLPRAEHDVNELSDALVVID
jgi:putative membrane protein